MPSTYTTNNGIEKIGTGEQSGTWGDTTNLNFDILDQALDGLVTITATDTGSSGSPNTLPITDGTLSDGRNRLIIITDGGDLGGSVYYQLTPADAEKIVFLRNSLSGSQDLILFQGTYNAARDLIVPAGKDVIIKFSGGGTSNAVVAPVFADLSLDAATIASADINGGTIDGVTIGVTSVATVINVDNLKLDGNTLSSTDTNGNVVLAPNGDGDVQLDADTVRVGDSNNDVTITTNGTGDLTLNTNGGTDSGSIEIQDGANTNIIVTANGTGKLELANGDITTSAASGSDAAGQDLTIQAGASTGNAAGGDMIFQTTPAGAGSGTNLNSYTTVLTLTDDSKMQIGTSTAVDSVLDEDDMNSDSATALATQQSIKAYVDAQVGANNELSEVLANGNTTGGTDIAVSSGDDITFADSSKAIFGGATSELQIYSDGTHSYIDEQGTGSLQIRGTNLNLKSSTNETYLYCVENGEVGLQYDNALKLATTSTGVDITGTLTSDGLTVDKTATISTTDYYASSTFSGTLKGAANNTKAALLLNSVSSSGQNAFASIHSEPIADFRASLIGTYSADGSGAGHFSIKQFVPTSSTTLERMRIDQNGDITFYDTSGNASFVYDESAGSTFNEQGADRDFRVESDGNANMFVVDASANAVGIGTNLPREMLHVSPAGNGEAIIALGDRDQVLGGPHGLRFYHQSGTAGDSSYLNYRTGDDSLNIEDTAEQQQIKFFALTGAATFNEQGNVNGDFRVESNNSEYMLYLDAGQDTVGIKTNATDAALNVNSQSNSIDGIRIVGSGGNNFITGYGNQGNISFAINENGADDPGNLKLYRNGIQSVFITADENTTTVFNDQGEANDFRVESDGNTHALFVDASANYVGITNSTPAAPLHVDTTEQNVAFFDSSHVSGTQWFIRNDNVAVDSSVQIGLAPANNISGVTIAAIAEEDFSVAANRTARLEIETRDNGNFQNRLTLGRTEAVFNDDSDVTDFRVESDGRTHMLFVDAANNRVGINNSAPAHPLDVKEDSTGTSTPMRLVNTNTTSESGVALQFTNTAHSGDNEGELRYVNVGVNNSNAWQFHGEIGGVNGMVNLGGFDGTFGKWTTQRGAIFNESGIDSDFRVESDTNTHALYVDAGNNIIGVGLSSPSAGATSGTSLNVEGCLSVEGTLNAHQTNKLVFERNGNISSARAYGATAGDGIFRIQVGGGGGSADAEAARFEQSTVVFNESSLDKDFRVESDGNSHMLFMDASTSRLGILKSAPAYTLDVLGQGRFSTSNNDPTLILQCTDSDASLGPVFDLLRNVRGTDGDVLGVMRFQGNDSADNVTTYAQVVSKIIDASNPTEDGQLNIETLINNDMKFRLNFTNSEVNFNESGVDSDFRVESDGNANMLKVDAGNDVVGIGTGSPSSSYGLHVEGAKRAVLMKKTSSGDGDLMQEITWDTSGFATRFYVAASGAGANGAATAMYIGRNNSTSRSINASGTINASGSDYAEYMVKADTAGTINKGDVCGIDVNGKLTTIWADAISFVVKSTDPSYVGGDVWFNNEERPEKDDVTAEEYAAFEERLEAARATVDRIAFSGQVPVNVTGATVGDYIVPLQDGTGITGQAVSNPTFDQYMSAVGKVIAIEDDGRAKIIVKIA